MASAKTAPRQEVAKVPQNEVVSAELMAEMAADAALPGDSKATVGGVVSEVPPP